MLSDLSLNTSGNTTEGCDLTVFIPAFNEEKNIEGAILSAENELKQTSLDYEILILNACSSDRTGMIADQIARRDPRIRVIHRHRWYGLGANYMEGVRQAKGTYFILFPGDNEIKGESLSRILNLLGESDIVIPYTENPEVRAIHRRVISKAFVMMLNFLFGLNLRYYNGNALHKTALLRRISVHSEDFAYSAEILIKLIRSGYGYREIGMTIKPITNQTAIFNFRNIFGVIKTITRLFYEVHISGKRTHGGDANG